MRYNDMFNTLKTLTNERLTDRRMQEAFGLKSPSVIVYKRQKNVFLDDEEIKKVEQSFRVTFPKQTIQVAEDAILGSFYPDIFASCGNGCYVLSRNKEPINIPKKFFVKPFSEFKTYSVIVARGNSMEPAIYDKDRLIIEHVEAGEQIKDGSIYVFCYDNSIYTKRLYKNIDEIIVKSDNENPIYQLKSIKKDDMNNVILIGEVVGLMRDLR